MPKFNAGDRVFVPNDAHGVPLEILGKQGTIVRYAGDEATGDELDARREGMNWQPMYEVDWDGFDANSLAKESWLERVG